MMSDWLKPEIAVSSIAAIGTMLAAYFAWSIPRKIAVLAEKMRQESETNHDARRFKLNIFAAIMQERANLFSEDCVRALNSIDVAFNGSVSVREAWAELFKVLNYRPGAPDYIIEERTRRLLQAMAIDLGLGDSLRSDDLGRVYYPEAIARQRQVSMHQTNAQYEQLMRSLKTEGGVTTEVDGTDSLWPPAPK